MAEKAEVESSMPNSRFSIVGVPIDCLGFDGPLQAVERMPESLRAVGLAERLHANDLGDLNVRIGKGGRDAVTGLISQDDCRSTTRTLRAETANMIRRGIRPFFVGGCCSMVPGIMAGLRDVHGNAALVYVDGHMDLYDGATSWQGEMADMPLAILLAKGPAATFNEDLGGFSGLNESIFLIGYRDEEEARGRGSMLPEAFEPALTAWTLDLIAKSGFRESGDLLAEKLSGISHPFHLHLDLDVLDGSVFPATMYQLPRGMLWNELSDLLAPIVAHPNLASLSVGCYDPDMDDGEALAPSIVENLGQIFG